MIGLFSPSKTWKTFRRTSNLVDIPVSRVRICSPTQSKYKMTLKHWALPSNLLWHYYDITRKRHQNGGKRWKSCSLLPFQCWFSSFSEKQKIITKLWGGPGISSVCPRFATFCTSTTTTMRWWIESFLPYSQSFPNDLPRMTSLSPTGRWWQATPPISHVKWLWRHRQTRQNGNVTQLDSSNFP